MKKLLKNKDLILGLILILAFSLIFLCLSRADIQHDDATYSFRSLGYFDYMDSNVQTSPISWFDEIPWWGKLSFHDHPPLVFAVQFLFFNLFGNSLFTARLPFALLGIATIYIFYLLIKKLFKNEDIALLSAFVLAVSSYHAWISRIGYLEIFVIFFSVLTFYLFLEALQNHKKFLLFGVSLGLAALTKYTSIFILPVVIVYLLIKNKKLLLNKYFIFSLIIAFLIFSPVVLYNIMMYKTRGHFDLQIAGLLGQDMSDWPVIGSRGTQGSYLSTFLNIFKNLFKVYSLPFFILILISSIYFLFRFLKNKKNQSYLFIFLVLLFAILEIIFIGSNFRFISIINPFLAAIVGYSIFKFSFLAKGNFNKILVVLLVMVFVCEIFYNINTNILFKPKGNKNIFYSESRVENNGFNQLEDYFISNHNFGRKPKNKLNSFKDFEVNIGSDINGGDVFVYDPTLNWFSSLWYLRRWGIYYKEFVISAADLSNFIPASDWVDTFRENGVKNMYYIRGKEFSLFDSSVNKEENKTSSRNLAIIFRALGASLEHIYNYNNEIAFEIYKLKINN